MVSTRTCLPNTSGPVPCLCTTPSNQHEGKQGVGIFDQIRQETVVKGSSINDVMPEGGGGVRVRMTNDVEGCIKKHHRGRGGGGG